MSAFLLEQKTNHARRGNPLEFSATEIECVKRLVGHSVAQVECELIRETLACYCGNRTRAAGVLDVSIRTLRNKLQQYKACGLSVPEPGRLD